MYTLLPPGYTLYITTSNQDIGGGEGTKKWRNKHEAMTECLTIDGSKSILEAAQKNNDQRITSVFLNGGDQSQCLKNFTQDPRILIQPPQPQSQHRALGTMMMSI